MEQIEHLPTANTDNTHYDIKHIVDILTYSTATHAEQTLD
jgi:hypothetical protein